MPNRQQKRRWMRKIYTLGALSIFSLFILSIGMGMLLTKSPQAKSNFYLSMAEQYQEEANAEALQADARDYLLKLSHDFIDQALQNNPYDPKLWEMMAMTMARRQRLDVAIKARDIAVQLGATHVPELTAAPSFKREKSLALSDTILSKNIMR